MLEFSEIDKYVIEKVKEARTNAGMSQKNLSLAIGLSEGFIGNIENPNRKEKYNIRHLNLIAKVLKCSPRDFMPDQPL